MKHDSETTAIVGAGALGVMYAQTILEAGRPVVFLADSERVDRLRRDALTCNGKRISIPAVEWGRSTYERVIIAIKHHHIPDVVASLPLAVSERTTVLSVMNGIDSERQLALALGSPEDPRVLHAMVAGMDAVREGENVRYSRIGKVFFGERRNDPGTPAARVTALQEYFDAISIPWETPADMERALWNKFMLNVGINQWSAVLRATYRVFHTSQSARSLMKRAMREVLVIARQRAIDLNEDDIDRWFEIVETLSPDGKTSMLQDIDAGRKTEVEMFAGRVVGMGKELNVPTPVNQVLLEAIQTLEETA